MSFKPQKLCKITYICSIVPAKLCPTLESNSFLTSFEQYDRFERVGVEKLLPDRLDEFDMLMELILLAVMLPYS